MSKHGRKIWYIYGAGGLGLETADILRDNILAGLEEEYEIVFTVDKPDRDFLSGYPVVNFSDIDAGSKITVAVGEPSTRRVLYEKCVDRQCSLGSIISHTAFVSKSSVIEAGVIIGPFASIQGNAKVSANVAVNTQAIISHDALIHAGAVISSQVNIGGASSVGVQSYIGMGALIIENTKIGSKSIVGMGSVVYKDVPDGMIALGNPARVVRKNVDEKVFR